MDCMGKISEQSETWTNDPMRDFTSDEWTDLEQHGHTSWVAAVVAIAEDLESEDQMRGARTALQECATDTADHLGLLIQVNEQIDTHKLAKAQWMSLHENQPWFSMEEY